MKILLWIGVGLCVVGMIATNRSRGNPSLAYAGVCMVVVGVGLLAIAAIEFAWS